MSVVNITDEDIERDVFGIKPDDEQTIEEDDFFDDLGVEGEDDSLCE